MPTSAGLMNCFTSDYSGVVYAFSSLSDVTLIPQYLQPVLTTSFSPTGGVNYYTYGTYITGVNQNDYISFSNPKCVYGQYEIEKSFVECSYVISLVVQSCSKNYRVQYVLSDYDIMQEVNLESLIENIKSSLKAKVIKSLREDNVAEWENWVSKGGTEETWLHWVVSVDEIDKFKKLGVRYEEDRLQREQEKERIKKETNEKLVNAKQKALQLLKEVIGEVRFAEYEKENYIELVMQSGKKYRLHNNTHVKNIEVLEKDEQDYKVKHRLCVHLSDMELPIEDNLVAQFLMLRDSEEEFLRMANVS